MATRVSHAHPQYLCTKPTHFQFSILITMRGDQIVAVFSDTAEKWQVQRMLFVIINIWPPFMSRI